jgi:hypothetical protein
LEGRHQDPEGGADAQQVGDGGLDGDQQRAEGDQQQAVMPPSLVAPGITEVRISVTRSAVSGSAGLVLGITVKVTASRSC